MDRSFRTSTRRPRGCAQLKFTQEARKQFTRLRLHLHRRGRRFRHRRLRAWAQNKNVDFGSETVNYEVTNNTWAQLPKANQKLAPNLGPNFQ